MKTPVCAGCAESRMLCSECSSRLKEGRLSEMDVEVSFLLYEINEKRPIGDAGFVKALNFGRVVLLLTEGNVGKLIGKQGKVVNEISEKLGKKVRVIEHSKDMKKSVSDMLYPARLAGINEIYTASGSTLKIRIPRREIMRLPVDLATLEAALHGLLEKPVKLEFE